MVAGIVVGVVAVRCFVFLCVCARGVCVVCVSFVGCCLSIVVVVVVVFVVSLCVVAVCCVVVVGGGGDV